MRTEQEDRAADAGPAELAVSMRGISKRFAGLAANDRVDFDLRRGEIHALLGENGAGKTTLMNILYGLVRPDEGAIEIDGAPVVIRSPKHAIASGIGMVHQHFMLVPDMTVAENVALGRRSAGRLQLRGLPKVAGEITALSERHGLRVDPDAYIEDLSVGMKQRVEIIKLLYRDARILILDEPTAVLTAQEWQELAEILRSLAAEGRSIVVITHKLDELTGVADRCTVLRDGARVDTVELAATDKAMLARMMVGRDVVLRVPRVRAEPGEVVLAVEGMTVADRESGYRLRDVSFQVRAGEVLGVAGIDGNGQQELVEALLGLQPLARGEIRLLGHEVPHLNAAGGDREGAVGVIPEDRHRAGCALSLTVQDNLILRDYRAPAYSRYGILRPKAIRALCARLVRDYDVRVRDLGMRMRQVSGGNQQKAVIARELHRQPALVIGAQPTRGLDVGAMDYVYQTLIEHKRRGGATLLISADLDEILSLSDRIAVLSRGRILRTLAPEEADAETLGLLLAGEAFSSSS
jgi:general nucleoside transport system ATP-binding protein